MEDKQLESLYELAVNSKDVPPPQHVLFGWKCPKCGSRISEKSEKKLLAANDEKNVFENKVAADAGLEPGIYDFKISYFNCKCGYKFAKAEVEPLDLDKMG